MWNIAGAQKSCSVFALQTRASGAILPAAVWQLHLSDEPFVLHHKRCLWEYSSSDSSRVAPLLRFPSLRPVVFPFCLLRSSGERPESSSMGRIRNDRHTTACYINVSVWMQVPSVTALDSEEPFDCTQLQIFSAVTSRNRNYEDQSDPSWVSGLNSKAGWSSVLLSL